MKSVCPRHIPVLLSALAAACCGGIIARVCLGHDQAEPAGATVDSARLTELIRQLGAPEYQVRESAQKAIVALGPKASAELQQRLSGETDPEIAYRLRYVLENLTPPDRAVLVLSAPPEYGLEPGDIITHLNGERVFGMDDLESFLDRQDAVVRAIGPNGPRDAGPLRFNREQVLLANYRAPRGDRFARALQLYGGGRVEQAYELIRELSDFPEDEFDSVLLGMIAHTAGDGARGERLVRERTIPADARPTRGWNDPSIFERRAPVPKPLRLEWIDLTRDHRYRTSIDPDLRVQRVLAAANRFGDALRSDAAYWWNDYRRPQSDEDRRNAGNMLAVVAWMANLLDLQSECARLIEPRSAYLGAGERWMRVQTDAWLPLLAGEPRAAVDRMFDHAAEILRQPYFDQNRPFRNPRVAAMVALFLYLQPEDPRIATMRDIVAGPVDLGISEYVRWMCFAANPANEAIIHRDLQKLAPTLAMVNRPQELAAAAILAYVQPRGAGEALDELLRLIESAPDPTALALVRCLRALDRDLLDEAANLLSEAPDYFARDVLEATIAFRREFDGAAPAVARRPLAAVPGAGGAWLLVTRDRALQVFDPRTGTVTALDWPGPRSTGWFPGPANWPWIGADGGGRIWAYDRRRVLEVGRPSGLHLNIRAEQIPAFHSTLSPLFGRFSDLVATSAAGPRASAEDGEFLRSELRAYREYTADPDLPDLGLIEPVPHEERLTHVALRGGPQMLVLREGGGKPPVLWSSADLQRELKLPRAPYFFAEALRSSDEAGAAAPSPRPPILLLMTEVGLVRLDFDGLRLERISLPGQLPYPALVPESTPYERRDPRYFYCARLPIDGGKVFRYDLQAGAITELDMVNEQLPVSYYQLRPRSEVRKTVDALLAESRLPDFESFIAEVVTVTTQFQDEKNTQ